MAKKTKGWDVQPLSPDPTQMDFFKLFDDLLGVKAPPRDGWTKCRRCGGVYLTAGADRAPVAYPTNFYRCPRCGWLPNPPMDGHSEVPRG